MPDGVIPSLSALVDSGKRTIKQKLADLLNNPLPYLQQTAGQLNEDAKSFNRTSIAAALGSKQAKEQLRSSMLNTAMNFAPALTVWHGSPHKFSSFDMSKIGTGEGAQAYGHGLYFSGNRDIAQWYADNLAQGRFGSQTAKDGSVAARISKMFHDDGSVWTRGGSEREIGDIARRFAKEKYVDNDGLTHYRFKDDSEWIASDNGWDIAQAEKNIYKSDIPDEAVARFLDWDKPLSQQAPAVRRAWEKTRSALPPNAIEDIGGDLSLLYGRDVTPGDFLGTMAAIGGRPDAGEQMLRASGVPGIRYLDGNSRAAGQGSSNFVLFDDQLPRILEINGTPTGLQPWKPGEWK